VGAARASGHCGFAEGEGVIGGGWDEGWCAVSPGSREVIGNHGSGCSGMVEESCYGEVYRGLIYRLAKGNQDPPSLYFFLKPANHRATLL